MGWPLPTPPAVLPGRHHTSPRPGAFPYTKEFAMAIEQKFTTDTAELDKAYAKLAQQNTKLIEQNKRLGRQSRQASEEARSGMASVTKQAIALGAALIGSRGVSVAVGEVKNAYADFFQIIDTRGKEAIKFHETLIKNLSEAGDLLQAPRITRELHAEVGVTREDIEAAFTGVTGGAPTLPLERRIELAKRGSRIGITGQDTRAFGELMGELAEVFPAKTADDIGDLALSMRQMAGKNIEQLSSRRFLKAVKDLEAAGVSMEKSVGMGMVALQHDIQPSIMTKLADAVTGEYAAIRHPRTEGQRDEMLYIHAAATERLAMLQRSEHLRQTYLGEQAVSFGRLPHAEVDAIAEQLRRAQAENLLHEEEFAVGNTAAGRALEARYRRLAREEKTGALAWAEMVGVQKEEFEKLTGQLKLGMTPQRAWLLNKEINLKKMLAASEVSPGDFSEPTMYEQIARNISDPRAAGAMQEWAAGQKEIRESYREQYTIHLDPEQVVRAVKEMPALLRQISSRIQRLFDRDTPAAAVANLNEHGERL